MMNSVALPFDLQAGGLHVGGLSSGGGARGLILALHGGGYDARYWHAHEDDPGSLLELGAAAGFRVLAVDRPGYRGSTTPDGAGLSLAAQADILFDLVEREAAGRPVFLIGHSAGGILAVLMAADRRAARLAAIDVSGVPLAYPPGVAAGVDALVELARIGGSRPTARGDEHRRALFYGADGSFDPALATGGDHPVSLNELLELQAAPKTLPPAMARIAIPLQWTIADREASSIGGRNMLERVRTLLPACPHVETRLQVASGHNISLHHVARAYHLRALAFFEESRALPLQLGSGIVS